MSLFAIPHLAAAAALGVALAAPVPISDAAAAEPQLKRVMLSTGGVGYFEFEAEIEGTQQVLLPVRLDQMDDVLKSIVVFDSAGNSGSVEMPGRSPLTDAFRTLPFTPGAFDGPQDLIAALKGAEIEVSGPVSATGRIVSVVEDTVLRNGETVQTRHRVTMLTRSGLQQFVLEEADTIAFTDARLQAQMDAALAAFARNAERDGRTLTITARGEGRRTLTIGYVAAAPLWKTSYRLTTDEAAGQMRLQGWAILENQSGTDWSDVELTLVSGNPVTFRQALYKAYYVDRPEIPVEIVGRILPPADRGDDEIVVTGARTAMAPPPPPPPPAPVAEAFAGDGAYAEPEPQAPSEVSERAAQILFRLPGAVSVGNGQSLSVPIVDTAAPGSQIAHFDPRVHGRHAMAAVELTNETGAALPPGAITLFAAGERGLAYVGDARFAGMEPGDSRVLGFALDQAITVETRATSDRAITRMTLSKGVLTLSVVDREGAAYTVIGDARAARSVLISHPRYSGYDLVEPKGDGARQSADAWRFNVEVPAGGRETVRFVQERSRSETVALVSISSRQIEAYAAADVLSAEQKAAFARMAELRGTIEAAEQARRAAENGRERLFAEQARIRENLAAVPERSDLQRRYLERLSAQEDEAERLAAAITKAEADAAAGEQALADFVSGLEL